MTESAVHIQLMRVEGAQLAQLVTDLRDLVGSERDLADPAVARLAPNPYPGDDAAAQAFSDATRDELLDRRSHDAEVVRIALADLHGDVSALSGEDALALHDLAIPVTDVDAWLRTLTALRLVIADRLGILEEDSPEPDDDRGGVYDWLGYRLEILIQAADELL